MKTSLVYRLGVAVTAVLLPLFTGCAQQTASNPPPTTIATTAPLTYPATDFAAATNTPAAPVTVAPPAPAAQPLILIGSTNAPAATNGVAAIEPPAELIVPANLRVSKALGELLLLAQSGVEESILLTYITNSPAAFLLGAEEIVYLKDLGVSSSVITSMMQRDQALKNQWGIAATAAPSPVVTNEEPIAVAPTYANQPAPVAVAEPAPVSETYFEETLSPYGTWVEVDGYGRCWRPTVVVTTPSWRPYCDNGRWVYSDSGWYWVSGYSWGSVAFHYGRWFSHPRYGWCWWPNNVWAPSWVSWRYNGNHCGWAPLPPNSIYTPGVGLTYFGKSVGVGFDFHLGVGSYVYVPWGRLCDPKPYQHCLPKPEVVAVFNRTTPVNQFGRGGNNRVENRGITPERYREHARDEVRPVKIREEVSRGAGPRPERFEGNGRTLVVNRPALVPRTDENRISAPVTVTPTRQVNNPRPGNRPAPIIVNGSASQIAPATTAPERSSRSEESIAARPRNNSPTVIGRQPERSVTPTPVTSPTPVTRPTPIFSKPVVVETTPQLNRPSQPSTTVIGGSKSGAPARDYSVWSSPTPRPTPTTPNNNSPRNPSVSRNPGGVTYTAPSPAPTSTPDMNRPRENNRSQEILAERSQRMERNSRSQVEIRSATPNYSAPSPRPTAPSVGINPAPAVNATPRPAYTAPVPAAPSAPPAAPSRVESSRPTSAPTASPDAGRSPRNR